MAAIPWTDRAVLTRASVVVGEVRVIELDQRLSAVAEYLVGLPRLQLEIYRVALPDRGIRPYSYSGAGLAGLLQAWRERKASARSRDR